SRPRELPICLRVDVHVVVHLTRRIRVLSRRIRRIAQTARASNNDPLAVICGTQESVAAPVEDRRSGLRILLRASKGHGECETKQDGRNFHSGSLACRVAFNNSRRFESGNRSIAYLSVVLGMAAAFARR